MIVSVKLTRVMVNVKDVVEFEIDMSPVARPDKDGVRKYVSTDSWRRLREFISEARSAISTSTGVVEVKEDGVRKFLFGGGVQYDMTLPACPLIGVLVSYFMGTEKDSRAVLDAIKKGE